MVLHSDLPLTGEFSCSDPLINQLQKNIQWSQRGNFIDVPTDCPQRDERLGWTGDAQVFLRTAAFNMEVAGFFSQWLQDLAEAQTARGTIPASCLRPRTSSTPTADPPGPTRRRSARGPSTCAAATAAFLNGISPPARVLSTSCARPTPTSSAARPPMVSKATATGLRRTAATRTAGTPKELIGTAYFRAQRPAGGRDGRACWAERPRRSLFRARRMRCARRSSASSSRGKAR